MSNVMNTMLDIHNARIFHVAERGGTNFSEPSFIFFYFRLPSFIFF